MNAQVNELLLQALETELGGVQVYETALRCVVNEDLKEEWEKYLEQTTHHKEILTEVFEKLGLDPNCRAKVSRESFSPGCSSMYCLQDMTRS